MAQIVIKKTPTHTMVGPRFIRSDVYAALVRYRDYLIANGIPVSAELERKVASHE